MNIFAWAVVLILIISALIRVVIERLNIRHIQTELPPEFSDVYDANRYALSQTYLIDNTHLNLVKTFLFAPLIIIFMLSGGFNWIDGLTRAVTTHPILGGLVYIAIIGLAAWAIGLPFAIFKTFVIEEKYEFNRTTPKTFVLDQLKALGLGAILGGVVLSFIFWFFGKMGPSGWIWVWAIVTAFQLFVIFIAPTLLFPIFNKFTPLEDGALKNAIADYARDQNYRLKGIFTIDGSRRSSKGNAFLTGLGPTKRIALFDTLIPKHTVDELVSVIAHEVGHFKKSHVLKGLMISTLSSGLMFFIFSRFLNNPHLFDAFKMAHLSVYASLVFFSFLYTPISEAIGLFSKWMSRRHEYEADAFAAETTDKPESMIAALKKLSADNLSNLTPHPLKVFWDYTHPPMLELVAHLRKLTQ